MQLKMERGFAPLAHSNRTRENVRYVGMKDWLGTIARIVKIRGSYTKVRKEARVLWELVLGMQKEP